MSEFTKEEILHMDISKVVVDFESGDFTAEESMKKIADLNIDFLK